MGDRKKNMAVINKFTNLYTDKFRKPLIINRNHAQWEAENLINSFGYDTTISIIDYYFSYVESPAWKQFVYQADKIYASMEAQREDREFRAEMRKKAKEWLENE